MDKEKDRQTNSSLSSAADTVSQSPTAAEAANPAFQLANGSDMVSEQKDMHALANGNSETPSQVQSGNQAGATALIQTAEKLEALMTHESTNSLELDDNVKERYAILSAVLRQYATANKAFLSSDVADFPANTFRGSDVAGVYDVNNDIIYLQKGPTDADAFNTIVHEISHAENRESADIKRFQEFGQKWGDRSENSIDFLMEKADMFLSVVKFELDAEIDGEVLEIIEKNKDEPERASGFKRNIDQWLSRTIREGSSAAAYTKWQTVTTEIAEFPLENPNLEFKGSKYKLEAEAYIKDLIEFPFAKSHLNPKNSSD